MSILYQLHGSNIFSITMMLIMKFICRKHDDHNYCVCFLDESNISPCSRSDSTDVHTLTPAGREVATSQTHKLNMVTGVFMYLY